jgi:hypothetical protein
MDIHKGDRVLVNIAPFIGATLPGKSCVSCRVLEVDGVHVHVCTVPPYREVDLWVLSTWVQENATADAAMAAGE